MRLVKVGGAEGQEQWRWWECGQKRRGWEDKGSMAQISENPQCVSVWGAHVGWHQSAQHPRRGWGLRLEGHLRLEDAETKAQIL